MIADPQKLRELVEELAELSLEQRRAYIASIEAAQGTSAAGQIRDALKEFWDKR